MRGISVSDENREQASEIEIDRPTSLSQVVSSVLAPTTRGRKTMIVVRVEQVTAIDTSRAPICAARFASLTVRRRRSIDSRTTMASSTSIPMPSISPHMDRMLSVLPMKYIRPQAAMTENGIHSDTMNVESKRRRKKYSTMMANTPPRMPACFKPSIPEVICFAWSSKVKSLIPFRSGSLSMSSVMTFITARTTSTVLAVDSLKMSRATAWLPSR